MCHKIGCFLVLHKRILNYRQHKILNNKLFYFNLNVIYVDPKCCTYNIIIFTEIYIQTNTYNKITKMKQN